MEIFPVTLFRQIAFIQNDNLIGIAGGFTEMRRPGRVAICYVETQVGQLQRFFSARNSFTLEFACRCSQAGSIEQTDWHTIQIDRFFDGVARRAMCFADDHSIVAEKPIEQARFAGIRSSVDHHPHTFAQNAPLIGGGEQRIDLLANRIEPPAQRFTFIRCDPFLRKINRRVDVGEQRN